MGSMSQASEAVGQADYDAKAEYEVARMAESLMAQYQGEADIMAARRADDLFRAGQLTQATQWLDVFRTIAMSHCTGSRSKQRRLLS